MCIRDRGKPIPGAVAVADGPLAEDDAPKQSGQRQQPKGKKRAKKAGAAAADSGDSGAAKSGDGTAASPPDDTDPPGDQGSGRRKR